jgi:hypothetical protein
MKHATFVAILVLGLAGCGASGSYLMKEYPLTRFDGYVLESETRFSVTHHTSRASFVTQLHLNDASGTAFLSGLTLGAVSREVPGRLHENAAMQVIGHFQKFGCKITRSSSIETVTYEHDYECQNGRKITREEIQSVTDGGLLTDRESTDPRLNPPQTFRR